MPEVNRLRREKFGFVFQQPFLLPYLTAIENIIISAAKPDRAAREKALALLADLGMNGLENKLPSQLSGGEKQRVSIVRAMMNDPGGHLCRRTNGGSGPRKRPTASSTRLRNGGTRGTVIVVTHDPEMLTGADRVLLLRDGQLVTEE